MGAGDEAAAAPPPSVFDRLGAKPPAAELLGWQLVAFDQEGGRARLGFSGRPEFANPTGHVQGGFLAAMLDEAMGSALIIATDGGFLSTTISMSTDFIRPAPVGPIEAEGRVVSLGKSIAFLEGSLRSAGGKLVARATASCKLVAMNPERIAKPDG
ncbi:MAG TPA: PaaI family thioesterase [Allosphingosinicella sp.]